MRSRAAHGARKSETARNRSCSRAPFRAIRGATRPPRSGNVGERPTTAPCDTRPHVGDPASPLDVAVLERVTTLIVPLVHGAGHNSEREAAALAVTGDF